MGGAYGNFPHTGWNFGYDREIPVIVSCHPDKIFVVDKSNNCSVAGSDFKSIGFVSLKGHFKGTDNFKGIGKI
jgi:hypothetical protein